MHKFITLFISISLLAGTVHAQQDSTQSPWEVNLSGFVRYDAFYQDREHLQALEGLLTLFPLDKNQLSDGTDAHGLGSFNMLSIASRMRLGVCGPDALGAKTHAHMEFDFTGRSNTAAMRFRQAWIRLDWGRSNLLVGRAWHPLFVTEAFPIVAALNTGAPFQVFNRSAQATYTHMFGPFTLMGSAITQSDYASPGPNGKSPEYLRNGLLPNLHLQVRYGKDGFLTGLAVDYKSIRPRTQTPSLTDSGATYPTDERLNTYALMAFAKWESGRWLAMARVLYGQNLYEHILPGGYAVSSTDSTTGRESYTPSTNLNTWLNILYGEKLKGGLFIGYSQNLGFGSNIAGATYGRALNIGHLYRLAPQILYKTGPLVFHLEYELTAAAYGEMDTADRGRVKNTETIRGNRLTFALEYFF